MAEENAKPKATRKPRQPKPTAEEKAQASQAAHDLIEAINWIDVAQRDDTLRPIYEQHCIISQGWIMAYDGVILAGHKIEQDGDFAPNTARLLSALVKSGDALTMSHDEQRGMLTVKSRKFRADVPCVPRFQVNVPMPEPAMWEVNDGLLIAMKLALPITKQAPEVITSSLLLTTNGTLMATDRKLFLEVFHGCAMYECVIPRHFAKIASAQENVTHAGFSEGALTLWYGQDKFLRCQLYERSSWPPNPTQLFEESKGVGAEIPKDFLLAVQAVMPHSDTNAVHLTGKAVMSAASEQEAKATHECAGLPSGVAFNGADLVKALRLASTMEYVDNRGLFIFGELFRGKVTALNELAPIGQRFGDNEPDAAHTAFDAPPGFVLPGVIDPASWQGAGAAPLPYPQPAPPIAPPIAAAPAFAFQIEDIPNPYADG